MRFQQKNLWTQGDYATFCTHCEATVNTANWIVEEPALDGGDPENPPMFLTGKDAVKCVASVFYVKEKVEFKSITESATWVAGFLEKERVPRLDVENTVIKFTLKIFDEFLKVNTCH